MPLMGVKSVFFFLVAHGQILGVGVIRHFPRFIAMAPEACELAFIRQSGDKAIMIFRFDQTDEAIRILMENSLTVINGSTLSTL